MIGKAGQANAGRFKKATYNTGSQELQRTGIRGQARIHVRSQIIVGDIALLRASGTDITATPRGYILTRTNDGIIRRIPCRHRPEDMKQELRILVDNGCLVRDVIVEHPIYGQLVGQLDISSRHDVDEFISQVSQSDAAPLSDLTGGIHLHTIICPDEETYDRVLEQLKKRGFIFEDHS